MALVWVTADQSTVSGLNVAVTGRPLEGGGRKVLASEESSSKMLSTKSTRAIRDEIFSRNSKRRFTVLQSVREREEQATTENLIKEGGSSYRESGSASLSAVNTCHAKQEDRPDYRNHSALVDEEVSVLFIFLFSFYGKQSMLSLRFV